MCEWGFKASFEAWKICVGNVIYRTDKILTSVAGTLPYQCMHSNIIINIHELQIPITAVHNLFDNFVGSITAK